MFVRKLKNYKRFTVRDKLKQYNNKLRDNEISNIKQPVFGCTLPIY